MGCDIHFHVEHFNKDNWISCDKWEPITDGDFRGLFENVTQGTSFYNDRNYDLFGILANVRNGMGFAGLDTGDGFNVITMPRGLPEDLSPMLLERADWMDYLGGHTPSWLTLAEILDFDWEQTTMKRGFVKAIDYADWVASARDTKQNPSGYATLVFEGDTVKIISEAEMIKRIEKIKRDDAAKIWRPKIKKQLKEVHCEVNWEVSYRNTAGSFLTETVPRMQKLGKPDQIRCVFWFDS